MDCNSKPFNLGDSVLIEYPDRKTPKVVGYKENPQTCGLFEYALITITANGVYYYDKNLDEWITSGEPVTKCIVWDIAENTYATDIPLDDGSGFAVFPCDISLITNFLTNGSIRQTTNPFLSAGSFGLTDRSNADIFLGTIPVSDTCPVFAIGPSECYRETYELGSYTYVNEAYISVGSFVYWLGSGCFTAEPSEDHVFGHRPAGFKYQAVKGLQLGTLWPTVNSPDSLVYNSSRGLSDDRRVFRIEHELLQDHSYHFECHLDEVGNGWAFKVGDTGHEYRFYSPYGKEYEITPAMTSTFHPNGDDPLYGELTVDAGTRNYTLDNRQQTTSSLTDESIVWIVFNHIEPVTSNIPNDGLFIMANCHFSVDANGRGNIAQAVPDIWSQTRNTIFESALRTLYLSVAEDERTGWEYKNIYPDTHNSIFLPKYTVSGSLFMRISG
jgi:hypothetical protein